MAIRFQKRIKILPGVRLNISKSGVSTTIGGRGASVNIGKRGIYGNAGIPGTGLSMRERLDKPRVAGTARSAAAERAAVEAAAQAAALRAHNAAHPGMPPLTAEARDRRPPLPVSAPDKVSSVWRGYFTRGQRRGRWSFVKASVLVWIIYAIVVMIAVAVLMPPQDLQIGQGVADMNSDIADIIGITAPGGDAGLGAAALVLIAATLLAGYLQMVLILQRARDAGAKAWMTWSAILASVMIPFAVLAFGAALVCVPSRTPD